MAGPAPTATPYPLPDPTEVRLGIVVAQWHGQITERLLEGATEVLHQAGLTLAEPQTLHAWRMEQIGNQAELGALWPRDERWAEDDDDEDDDDAPDDEQRPTPEGGAPMHVVGQTNPNATHTDYSEADDDTDAATDGGYAVFYVPGAFELPVAAQHLGERYGLNAIITLGCVVRGGTPHFDYVCQATATGVMQAGLTLGIPVIFGVLTTDTEEQALERVGGAHGHKGRESAQAALHMLGLFEDDDFHYGMVLGS